MSGHDAVYQLYGDEMNKIEDEKLMPPIDAIRVISCGKDWTSDTDTTLPVDKIRGFSLDDWGVHLYSAEKDIHGEYDNVNVPYSNLSAVVFYFNRIQKEVIPVDIPMEYFESGGK